jgi:hypothetical protein
MTATPKATANATSRGSAPKPKLPDVDPMPF